MNYLAHRSPSMVKKFCALSFLCQLRTQDLHCVGTHCIYPSPSFSSSQLVPGAELHTGGPAVFFLPPLTNYSADCALILMSIL